MVTEAEMAYGTMAIDGYLMVLKTIADLQVHERETTSNYDEVVGLTLDRLEETKNAFASRRLLKEVFDYNILDEKIEEFEDFLEGRRNNTPSLENEILKLYVVLKSLNTVN